MFEIPETSKTWGNLLSFIDPRATAASGLLLDEVIDILETARRYHFADQTQQRIASLSDPFIDSHPVRVYAFASAFARKEDWALTLAKRAALETLGLPFPFV